MATGKFETLTKYQQAQLLKLHLCGEFQYKNAKGNKVARNAWVAMLRALQTTGAINDKVQVTHEARQWLNQNHLNISLEALN